MYVLRSSVSDVMRVVALVTVLVSISGLRPHFTREVVVGGVGGVAVAGCVESSTAQLTIMEVGSPVSVRWGLIVAEASVDTGSSRSSRKGSKGCRGCRGSFMLHEGA